MINFKQRKLVKIGQSLWLCAPIEWTRSQKLAKGDRVVTTLSESGDLIVRCSHDQTQF